MDFGAVLYYMGLHPFFRGNVLKDKTHYNKFKRDNWVDGRYIFLNNGCKVPLDKWDGDIPPFNDGHFVIVEPHIDMITEKGSIILGWMPTQEDMLATDWIAYEGK